MQFLFVTPTLTLHRKPFSCSTLSFLPAVSPLPSTGVKAIFCGHYHRNAGGCHDGLDVVVSSAIGCQLGEDTHGVRVVVVTADEVVHRYHSLERLRAAGMDPDLCKLLKS